MKEQILEKLSKIESLLFNQEKPLKVEEAAEFLGISTSHLYKLTSSRQIPHYKNGKIIYFKKSELSQWAFSNNAKTQDELEQEAIDHVLFRRS